MVRIECLKFSWTLLCSVTLVLGCASSPYSSDLRACWRVSRSVCGDADRCALEREIMCMGERGWEYVRGRGYVRVYVERDRAREIEAQE